MAEEKTPNIDEDVIPIEKKDNTKDKKKSSSKKPETKKPTKKIDNNESDEVIKIEKPKEELPSLNPKETNSESDIKDNQPENEEIEENVPSDQKFNMISEEDIKNEELDDGKEDNFLELTAAKDIRKDNNPQIKQPFKRQTTKELRDIKKLDLNNRIQEIENYAVEADGMNEEFIKQWVDTRVNPHLHGRIRTIPCLVSGYVAEMKGLSHFDIININSAMSEQSFAKQKILKFRLIYNHITWISKSSKKHPTFLEWMKMTKISDIETLFFGLFDATWPGESEYHMTCLRCKNEFPHTVPNSKLITRISEQFDKKDPDRIIAGETDPRKVKSIKVGNIESKKVLNNGIYVKIRIPTVFEYANSLRAIESNMDIDSKGVEDTDDPAWFTLAMIPYVFQLGLPVISNIKKEDGSSKKTIEYHLIEDRNMIASILKDLDPDNYDLLYRGENLNKIFYLDSITFHIPKTKCANPKCKADLKEVYIPMENMFFLKINQVLRQ